MKQRIAIERLELDLRGLPSDMAEATARAVGPALARALAGAGPINAVVSRIDAGAIVAGAAPDAATLSRRIAERVAKRTTRGG